MPVSFFAELDQRQFLFVCQSKDLLVLVHRIYNIQIYIVTASVQLADVFVLYSYVAGFVAIFVSCVVRNVQSIWKYSSKFCVPNAYIFYRELCLCLTVQTPQS